VAEVSAQAVSLRARNQQSVWLNAARLCFALSALAVLLLFPDVFALPAGTFAP